MDPGTRVLIRGLVARPELNGLRATVAGREKDGRVPCALDRGGPLINCKLANIEERPGLNETGMTAAGLAVDPAARAPVLDGRLREDEGRNFHQLLDLSRWHANSFTSIVDLGDEESSAQRLHALRSAPTGLAMLRTLSGQAWTYWDTPAAACGVGIHAMIVQDVEYNIKVQGGGRQLARREQGALGGGRGRGRVGPVNPALVRLHHEITEGDAACWGDAERRVAGRFFALEQREEGTLLLRSDPADLGFSDGARGDALYLACGIANGIGALLGGNGLALPIGPIELTLLPWGRRWVYDGLIGSLAPVSIARNTSLCEQLRARAAELEGRGELHHMPPPMTSELRAAAARRISSAHEDDDDETGSDSSSTDSEEGGAKKRKAFGVSDFAASGGEETEVSPALQALARSIASHRVEPKPADGETGRWFWVLRRFDYSEATNPEHLFILMSATRDGGGPLASWASSAALDPTPAELLKYVEAAVLHHGYRPAELAVDTQSAVAGVRAALRPCAGTTVSYYPPPSNEETAAASTFPY